jgi:hypothetical protein
MLVCSVSLRPPRSAIAADIAEIATAVDATTTGNVVFATLVDDPASVGEIVDAYLGEIMLEAASAADVVSLAIAYDAAVAESVTAADVPNGTIIPPGTTWNPSDISANVTLSGSNLTATASGNGAVRATAAISSGKVYFEIKMTVWLGANPGPGVALSSVTLPWINTTTGVAYVDGFGQIRINGATSGSSLGTSNSNDVIGCAVDRGANLIWFRKAPAGNWNGSGTADPATGTGGLSISAIAGSLYPGAMFTNNTEQAVANFGASAFVGTIPSGFTAGP